MCLWWVFSFGPELPRASLSDTDSTRLRGVRRRAKRSGAGGLREGAAGWQRGVPVRQAAMFLFFARDGSVVRGMGHGEELHPV